jgi:hypothetical protein
LVCELYVISWSLNPKKLKKKKKKKG